MDDFTRQHCATLDTTDKPKYPQKPSLFAYVSTSLWNLNVAEVGLKVVNASNGYAIETKCPRIVLIMGSIVSLREATSTSSNHYDRHLGAQHWKGTWTNTKQNWYRWPGPNQGLDTIIEKYCCSVSDNWSLFNSSEKKASFFFGILFSFPDFSSFTVAVNSTHSHIKKDGQFILCFIHEKTISLPEYFVTLLLIGIWIHAMIEKSNFVKWITVRSRQKSVLQKEC